MKNHNHDLVQQLAKLLDSKWRFKQYKKDAKGCKHCKALWDTFDKDFDRLIEAVRKEIVSHAKSGNFN